MQGIVKTGITKLFENRKESTVEKLQDAFSDSAVDEAALQALTQVPEGRKNYYLRGCRRREASPKELEEEELEVEFSSAKQAEEQDSDSSSSTTSWCPSPRRRRLCRLQDFRDRPWRLPEKDESSAVSNVSELFEAVCGVGPPLCDKHRLVRLLNVASFSGCSAFVVALIDEHGADVNAFARHDFSTSYRSGLTNHFDVAFPSTTPLHTASREGHLSVIVELIKRKADVDARSSNPARGEYGATALHCASTWGHSYQGHVERRYYLVDQTWRVAIIAELVTQGGADVNAKDSRGRTSLHLASVYGLADVVGELIKQGADVDAVNPEVGWTSLGIAMKPRLHADVVCKLIEGKASVNLRGVDPDRHARMPKDQYSPLGDLGPRMPKDPLPIHLVCQGACGRKGIPDPIRPISLRPIQRNWTACDAVFEKLLRAGAKLDSPSSAWGISTLACGYSWFATDRAFSDERRFLEVVEIGHLPAVREFIQLGADVNMRSADGMAPLHVACNYAQYLVIDELLRQNADPLARTLEADKNRSRTVADYVLFGCGDCTKRKEYLSEIRKCEVMDQRWKKAIVESYSDEAGIIPLVFLFGVDPSATFAGRRTQLHIVCGYGDWDAVVDRIRCGDDVNAKDQFGVRPLHLASFFGHLEIVSYLIEKKADVSAKSVSLEVVFQMKDEKNVDLDAKEEEQGGFAPLHFACASRIGHVGVVRKLLEKESPFSYITLGSAFHIACWRGHIDIVSLLIGIPFLDLNFVISVAGVRHTPLDSAISEGHDDIVDILKKHGNKRRIEAALGEVGEDTFLHVDLSSDSGHLDAVSKLPEKGCHVDEIE